MDLRNLTPFPALGYDVLDVRGEEHHVVVARGTYDLVAAPRAADGACPALTHGARPAREQASVAVKDEYFGEVNQSSVKQESDLAPGKPRCDVIVVGSAHSPTGAPVGRVEVGVHVRRLAAIPPFAEAGERLDRRLVVHGARDFVRRSLALGGGFRLTDPEPFVSQPLRYEHAFGGEVKVYAGDEAAPRVRREHRLSEEVRARHPEGAGAPVAHAVCLHNPLGVGWIEGWYAEAAAIQRWPAPRIEAPDAPLTAALFERLLRGDARAGDLPALTPQGFGVVAKPWQPRLALAGTLDDRWEAERWPLMPLDYDLGYWNGAHAAMQCDPLFGGELVELRNLLPPGAPGVVTAGGATVCRLCLPDPVVAARLKRKAERLWTAPRVDTLILDLEAMRVSMVWRLSTPAAAAIERATLFTLQGRPLPADDDGD
jgi:hypothetical protein